MAFGPHSDPQPGWHTATGTVFPVMIGMIALPVVLRALAAIREPTPAKIQTTIKVGILSIIPLAAAYAFLGAGPLAGLGVFALAIPSLVLAARLRVT